jgi:hypothetical protein
VQGKILKQSSFSFAGKITAFSKKIPIEKTGAGFSFRYGKRNQETTAGK